MIWFWNKNKIKKLNSRIEHLEYSVINLLNANKKILGIIKQMNDKSSDKTYLLNQILQSHETKINELVEKNNNIVNAVNNQGYKLNEIIDSVNDSNIMSIEEMAEILDKEEYNEEYDTMELNLDNILDKINKYGINSLTKREKEFLKNQQ